MPICFYSIHQLLWGIKKVTFCHISSSYLNTYLLQEKNTVNPICLKMLLESKFTLKSQIIFLLSPIKVSLLSNKPISWLMDVSTLES